MKSIQGLSLAHVALHASRDAGHCVAQGTSHLLTHAQWVGKVQAWHAAFVQVAGSDIGMYFDDAIEFAAALWGAWHAGKTPVLASDAQAHTLACLMPTVHACAGNLPGALKPHCIAVQTSTSDITQPLDLQATHVVMFTSGSTGHPERIVKKLAQLDAEVHALQCAFGSTANSPAHLVATVSHQHIYGLLFRILWPLSAGRAIGADLFRYPEEVLAAVQAHPQCMLVSSPAFLSRLPDALPWSDVRERLQLVFSSGGPLSEEAAAHCLQLLGLSPIEVFGSSETGGIAWRQRAAHGAAWQLLPGVQARIGEDGVLLVQSPHLAQSTQWHATADRACMDHEGASFVLQGRVDRVVKIAEKRVSLTAMEQALHTLEWVQQAKAVVLEQGSALVRVGMVLELTDTGWQYLQQHGRRAMAERLREHLSAYVERVALPRSWRYVTRLPVNAQSKTTQQSLLQLFHPTVPTPAWELRSAQEAIAQLYVDPSLRVFEGHFPQATLVPGVAQMHWVVTLGQQAFGIEPSFTRAEVLKFQQPILPGDTVQLHLQWSEKDGRLQFSLTSTRGPHASGKLIQGAL